MSLEEALAYLDKLKGEEVNVDQIFIKLPSGTVGTNENSKEDDTSGIVYNLIGRQLRAPVELKLQNNLPIMSLKQMISQSLEDFLNNDVELVISHEHD